MKRQNIDILLRHMRQQTAIKLPLIGSEWEKDHKMFEGIPYDLSYDCAGMWFIMLAGKNNKHLRCAFWEIL